jgi:hypothetical protein
MRWSPCTRCSSFRWNRSESTPLAFLNIVPDNRARNKHSTRHEQQPYYQFRMLEDSNDSLPFTAIAAVIRRPNMRGPCGDEFRLTRRCADKQAAGPVLLADHHGSGRVNLAASCRPPARPGSYHHAVLATKGQGPTVSSRACIRG